MVRVRFAPSPTGYLHIGGARTALFNWLYARRHGGVFVLRIEDTDTERSSWEMVSGIVDGLRWLGLDWDEGPDVGGPHAPYFQSQRIEMYRALAERLVAGGQAYYCYCTTETLQQKRQAAEAAGGGWIYDRACCALSTEAVARHESAGSRGRSGSRFPLAARHFRIWCTVRSHSITRTSKTSSCCARIGSRPITSRSWQTMSRWRSRTWCEATITFPIRPSTCCSIRRSRPRRPTSLTCRLILGPDRKRLSKRHGATSVMEYHRLGYLPEAMVNFLSLLGWSPGNDRELFTRDELVAAFTLEGISGGNAAFNPEKLDWFNQQHIMRLPLDDLAARVEDVLREGRLWSDELAARPHWLGRAIELVRPRVKRLSQFVEELRPFLEKSVTYDAAAVGKHLSSSAVRDVLAELPVALAAIEPFSSENLEPALRGLADSHKIKAAALIHATRVAVTGRAVSPGLFDVLELLGLDLVSARIHNALNCLPK